MSEVDFDKTFITRKRKKWKFAHFNTYENCFELGRKDDSKKLNQQLESYLPANKKLVLELAAGNAQFSLALAKKYPKTNFVAIDIKSDRLYTSAKQALEEGVSNIAFVRTHMNELTKIFEPKGVDEIWLTFPDPYPKKRSAKHRLTHPHFLAIYRTILKNNGKFKYKTDNRDLFLWSLEQFVSEKWQMNELSFDLHESNLPADYKIKTYYEEKFTAQNIPINFVSF